MTRKADERPAACFEAFRDGGADWWNRHTAPDFMRRHPGLTYEVRGPEGLADLAKTLRAAFFRDSVPDHPGDKRRRQGARSPAPDRRSHRHLSRHRATGRPIDFVVMDLLRTRDGKLVEHWAQMDNFNLLKQIGAVGA